jgi:hypothetical protein
MPDDTSAGRLVDTARADDDNSRIPWAHRAPSRMTLRSD